MKTIKYSTELFQQIFETSISGIIVVDNIGRIVLANVAAAELFGYESVELIAKNIELLIPEKLNRQYYINTKNQKDCALKSIDVKGIKKDGDAISLIVDMNAAIINDKNATIVFFENATQHKNDLITIKKTNIKLIESNRKLDTLINNLKGIVFRCKNNPEFDIDYISEGCLEITGYHSENFKNHIISFGELILFEDREYVWDKIQQSIEQKIQYEVEYRIRHKDGGIKFLLEKGKSIFNEDDNVEMLEGFIADITPLKESLLDLHKSDVKIKALLEAIPDTILVQDREGNYLDCYSNNPERLLMPPKKFLGLNMKEVLPESVFLKIKKSHELVIETGTMQLAEYSFSVKDKIVHHEARVVLMNDHSLLTIIRDITQKKTTDQLLSIRNNALTSAINSIVISDAQIPNIPIIYCNQAFEKMTGYTADEILGRNCHFLQNDDRDQSEIDIMNNAVISGKACNVILRNYKKDGTLFWNDVTITPVYNNENEITHFIGVQSDVTDKVNAENLKEQIKKTLELIAKDKSLNEISNTIVATIENHIKNCVVSILLLDSNKEKFSKLVAPNVPPSIVGYIEEATLNSESSLQLMSSFLENIVIVPDISQQDLWKQHEKIAYKIGIKACWSFPFLSSTKEVLGIFAIFSQNFGVPSKWENDLIMDMIDLISIPIEKDNISAKLQESNIQVEKYAQELEERVQQRTHEVLVTVQKLVETNFNLEDQIIKAEQAEKFARNSRGMASEIAKNFPNGFVVVMDKDLKILFAEGEGLTQLKLENVLYEGLLINQISTHTTASIVLKQKDVLKTLDGQRLAFEFKYQDRYFAVNTVPLIDDAGNINNSLHVYSDISLQKKVEFSIQKALEKNAN